MKAIIVTDQGKAEVKDDVPIPKIRDEYVLVKTVAVALNPTDWKHIDFVSDKGAKVGCDFSGIVEEVGKSVTKPIRKGDRVLGIVHGGNISNHEDGAFGEYLVCKVGALSRVPEKMSMTDAATFGVGIVTVGQALYMALGLPLPSEPATSPITLLIYGGSSATGTQAIQWAKLSGLTVVTTASPRNHALLKSIGADYCFDYNDPKAPEEIRKLTNDNLRYAFDCITEGNSLKFCADSLASDASKGKIRYTGLLQVKGFPRDDVTAGFTMAYTAVGEKFEKRGVTTEAKPDHYEQASQIFALAEKLLASGQLSPHPAKLGENGFQGVLDGLQQMREGKVSGQKLVYVVDETT